MKKYLAIVLVFFPFCLILAQPTVGFTGGFAVPIGTLNYRFEPTASFGVIYSGTKTGDGLYWTYFAEYINFSKEKRENLNVLRKVTQNNKETIYSIPLPKLKMSLEIAGIGAQMNYPAFSDGNFSSSLHAGFGLYRWFNKRGEVIDSLFANTPTGPVYVEYLKVSESNQLDWSGGVNLGITGAYTITDRLTAELSTDYRLIIGELWAALKLDLENVSGIQMANVRFGLSYRF